MEKYNLLFNKLGIYNCIKFINIKNGLGHKESLMGFSEMIKFILSWKNLYKKRSLYILIDKKNK